MIWGVLPPLFLEPPKSSLGGNLRDSLRKGVPRGIFGKVGWLEARRRGGSGGVLVGWLVGWKDLGGKIFGPLLKINGYPDCKCKEPYNKWPGKKNIYIKLGFTWAYFLPPEISVSYFCWPYFKLVTFGPLLLVMSTKSLHLPGDEDPKRQRHLNQPCV